MSDDSRPPRRIPTVRPISSSLPPPPVQRESSLPDAGRDGSRPARASSAPPWRASLMPPPDGPVEAPEQVRRSLDRMTSTVGELGRLIGSTLGLRGLQDDEKQFVTHEPGTPAGIDHLAGTQTKPEPGTYRVRVIDVCDTQVETRWVDDLDEFLATPRPAWSKLRWIDVDGLQPYVVNRFQKALGLHTLAAEDVLHVPQRPRVDAYADHLFIVARMFSWRDSGLISEQISMFVKSDLLLSFQELDEDVWNPVRDRLQRETSKLRQGDVSYLAYTLLDATVDHCFPILERYGEMLDHLEDAVLASSATNLLQEVHAIRRELTVLRKAVWPIREVIAELSREDQILVSPEARTYLRDVYQHCIQIIDIIETFRELASSLTDVSLSMASNRMNEIMKVLTMMSTVFIPITFLAGVYGMNFQYFPELHWKHSYALFWAFCGTLTGALLWFFRSKGWIGRR